MSMKSLSNMDELELLSDESSHASDIVQFETDKGHESPSPKRQSKRSKKALSASTDDVSLQRQRPQVSRRERNRLHARNSRDRRKHELDSLRQEASSLREENVRLHQLISSNAPSLADQLCNEIASAIPSAATLWRLRSSTPQIRDIDYGLLRDTIYTNRPFLFLDTPLPGKYILYVSPTLEAALGFRRQDILGQEWSSIFGPEVEQFYAEEAKLHLNTPFTLRLRPPNSLHNAHDVSCTMYALHTHSAVLCYMCVFGSK